MIEQAVTTPDKPETGSASNTVLSSLLGALAHTGVSWLALQLDFFRGGADTFYAVIGLIWSGYVAFALLFISGVNRRWQDHLLTLPLILWSTFGLLLTAYYIDQVRLCVMVMFFAIVQPGVFKLRVATFAAVCTACVLAYGGIVWYVNRTHPEAIDLTAELIQWAAFALIAGGVVTVVAEISSIRHQLSKRNGQLTGLIDRIQEMAIRDELTGLYNRRHAVERMIKIREMANRNALDFSVCYVDLDFFKAVNDSYGHHQGDEVLREFSALLRSRITGRDFGARLGGEEFLIVLVKSDIEQAKRLAEEIRQATMKLSFSASDLRVTVSIGLAQFTVGESLDHLLARADDALYQAKESGRNRVCTATEGS